MSGVMYSVQVFTAGHAGWVSTVLTLNPGTIYPDAGPARAARRQPGYADDLAPRALAWAVGTFAVSYLYFWRGEEEYGNV